MACGVRGAPLGSVVACGCGVRRRVAAAKASARQGQRGHEPGRLLSLAATLMLLARRSTEDPPERREAVQRPRAGLLLRAPHHSSRRMALRYFTLSSSLCAETIGGAWEVRLEKNMERVRAMIGISFYLYEMGSARAPKGIPVTVIFFSIFYRVYFTNICLWAHISKMWLLGVLWILLFSSPRFVGLGVFCARFPPREV